MSDLGNKNFYPRTPAGCDDSPAGVLMERVFISIHAPLRGATVIYCALEID